MPKPKFDKSKYSKAGKEQHAVKVVSTKRPITKPPTKDKAVLSTVRWVPGGARLREAARFTVPVPLVLSNFRSQMRAFSN